MRALVLVAMLRVAPGLLSAAPALGESLQGAASGWFLEIDPEASDIRVSLGATLHTVHGTIAVERGGIRFDPETSSISGEGIADAGSANTGHDGRDRDMHRKVLESDRFPRIVFEATKLVGVLSLTEISRVEIHGRLKVHGAIHPIIVPTETRIEGTAVSAMAHLNIPYVEWGMNDPSKLLLRVKKLVEVEVNLKGNLRPIIGQSSSARAGLAPSSNRARGGAG